jgi:hypothetical protein
MKSERFLWGISFYHILALPSYGTERPRAAPTSRLKAGHSLCRRCRGAPRTLQCISEVGKRLEGEKVHYSTICFLKKCQVQTFGTLLMSLVNGRPLIPIQKQGGLVACSSSDLTPTWAWSWNAGVPLNRCWVYF